MRAAACGENRGTRRSIARLPAHSAPPIDGARVQLYEQTKGHCIPGSGWQAARTQAALKT